MIYIYGFWSSNIFQSDNSYNLSLLGKVITLIIVIERLSYNPIIYYHLSYEYTGSAYVFTGTGPLISSSNESYLSSNYNILIKSN